MTDDPTVDTDELHGLLVEAVWSVEGEIVQITTCPELTPEQVLRLIDRAVNALMDVRREALETIGSRS